MSAVPVWTMFAYMNGDEEAERDEYRHLAEWRVEDALRWARHRGYDQILFTRTDETVEFTRIKREGS